MTTRIAAVMTCHNRREKTLACLASLREQRLDDIVIDVVLVDDGSTDGTATAVEESFPEVEILCGDGALFWAPGMRLALAHAARGDYDFYLWLNDDTELDKDAVETLLATYREVTERGHFEPVVVGSTRDPRDGAITYGGRVRPSAWRPSRFQTVNPADRPLPVATMNGNVVLVPRAVYRTVGNMSPYRHSFADQDYGLRVRAAGFSVWTAPGTVAACSKNENPTYGRRYGEKPLSDEVRALFGIKGLLPKDWLRFSRRWHGPFWPLWAASPYLRGLTGILVAHARLRLRRKDGTTALGAVNSTSEWAAAARHRSPENGRSRSASIHLSGRGQ